MTVRLTEDARMVITAALEWGYPLTRDGFQQTCARNPLLAGYDNGRTVDICVRAVERVGVENAIRLAHADIDFRAEDFREDDNESGGRP